MSNNKEEIDYKGLCIDVGANSGDFCLEFAKRNPLIIVIAIEPIPRLANQIVERASKLNLGNLLVHQLAIDTSQGTCKLNLSLSGDYGTSSLLEFNDENLKNNEYWSKRDDLRHSETLDVNRTRLDILLEQYPDLPIKYIKIDAQGFDLKVMESLGNKINSVEAGSLEAYTSESSNLYLDVDCSVGSVCNNLQKNNLSVVAIKPNDPACNEVNVFFAKNASEYKKLEIDLNLKGIPNYDDKNFWHCPSSEFFGEIANQAIYTLKRIQELSSSRDSLVQELNNTRSKLNEIQNSLVGKIFTYFKK